MEHVYRETAVVVRLDRPRDSPRDLNSLALDPWISSPALFPLVLCSLDSSPLIVTRRMITYEMILLIGVGDVAVGGCRLLVGPVPEDLLLLGDLLADAVDAADARERQVTVGRVREPGGVRRVRRVTRAEVRVVDRHHDRAVLLGHGRDRVRVVGIG